MSPLSTSEAKDLVSLLAERASAWQGLWTLLYTVSAAIVALIASGKLMPEHRGTVSTIAAVGFLLFAVGNYIALYDLQKQRVAIVEFVKEKATGSPHIIAVAQAAAPLRLVWLNVYHWGLCAFVIILLFVMPAYQGRPSGG
jgi:hypothetical protein